MAKGPLELDDPDTWPPLVLQLLERKISVIKAHADFERDRYALLGSGASERELSAGGNPFEEARRRLFTEINELVRHESLLAYHCSRLTEDEVAAVRQLGLLGLGEAPTAARLALRVAAGDLAQEDVDTLLGRFRVNAADAPRERMGKIWAVSSPRALSDEFGLSQPFRYWGGEAVLSLVDPNREKLAAIGTACIVEFEAPVARLAFDSLPEDLAQRYLHLFAGGEDQDGADVCVEGNITPHQILNIFRYADPEFERLTRCSTWSMALT